VVTLAAINTGIAIYYYLSVVKTAYTTDPEDSPAVTVDGLNKAVGIALVVLIIIMGALPAKIVAIADTAVKSIM
jgi:NADH-quinone oxidoreductase subunit N